MSINQTNIYIRSHLLNIIREQIDAAAVLALGVMQYPGYAEKKRKYISNLENYIGSQFAWKKGERI